MLLNQTSSSSIAGAIFLHPFGSQASNGDHPSALGFASRPYDRFAFIEDLRGCRPSQRKSSADRTSSLKVRLWQKNLCAGATFRLPALADASASHLSLETYVKSAGCQMRGFRQS